MKHSGRITLILLLILTMILSACGNAGRSSTEEEEQSTRSRRESTAEAETEEETKPSRPDILSWQPLWQQHLAAVIREKQELYGKPCFVKDFITRVNGMGLVLATDLDGDRKEELIFVTPKPNDSGYYDYVMEIWKSGLLSAECLYTGPAYRMGADNIGIGIWEDEKGSRYVLYDTAETMNGRYLGRVSGGRFEEVCEFDWSRLSYDRETDRYTYDGKSYRQTELYTVNCYDQSEEETEYQAWRTQIKEGYENALAAVGLAKEGAKIYTPGLTSLPDDQYLRVRVTYVNTDGQITSVWEYDYDSEGREIRSYCNDIMRSEKSFNEAGILTHEVSYNSKGIRTEEDTYDDNGNLLDKKTYTDGRVNWHYEYTYDEKGRMATATMGLGGLKEYEYNDDDVMIEARTVDPSSGEVVNTHTFELDEQGRHAAEYLNTDGMHLKYKTWEYREDGGYIETAWAYQAVDSHADRYYIEGREKPDVVTTYDAAGNVLRIENYTYVDYGSEERCLYSTEESSYDADGHVLSNTKCLYNKGVLSYEERTESSYTEDGQLKHRENYYHCYGYWTNLGEVEREISFTGYEADFNEQGYRVHVVTRKNDDPYGKGEDYQNNEMFILYENAYGDQMGMEP